MAHREIRCDSFLGVDKRRRWPYLLGVESNPESAQIRSQGGGTMDTKRSGIASMLFVHGMILAAGMVLALRAAVAADAPGVVAQINGAPMVRREGKPVTLQAGTELERGDIITTDGKSKVRIVIADESELTVGPNSRLIFEEIIVRPKDRVGRLQVVAGSFKIAISKFLAGPTNYEIRTQTAVVGVRGTVVWGDIDLDSVCSLEGNVEVRSRRGGNAVSITAGECVQKMGLGSRVPLKPSQADLETYLKAVTLD
jgi:hypothetical protein